MYNIFSAPIKQFCSFLFASTLILMSCKETDEVSTPGSQFVVINTLDSHTNFSLYDYPTDNLNERFYTTDSETSVFGANRKGNHIYIATDFFTPGKTLRKVDIT